MHRNLKIAWLAIACLAVVSKADLIKESENVDTLANQQKIAAALKAEFGENVDTSFEGYDHFLSARDGTAEAGNAKAEDSEFAAQHAQALADDDEDYDAVPDGVDEAEYQKELNEKDAETSTSTIFVQRREAEAEAEADPIVMLTAAQKKRLGRMKPHFAKHADRISNDLRQLMKRFSEESDGLDEDVDVSLEGYDHELVRRESESIDNGANYWEESQEELKGYDHSSLPGSEDEEHVEYLKQWNPVVARDFKKLDQEEDDDDDDDNNHYAAPYDIQAGTTEKRALTRLQKLRKGVKVMIGYED